MPQSEELQVETEYGMSPSYYGRSIEIDHIGPLELGGSNNISNVFPEPGSGMAIYQAKHALRVRRRRGCRARSPAEDRRGPPVQTPSGEVPG